MALEGSEPWTTNLQARSLLERWSSGASNDPNSGAYDTDRMGALGYAPKMDMLNHPGYNPQQGYMGMPSWSGGMMPLMQQAQGGGGPSAGWATARSSYLNPQMYIPGTPLNLWAMAHDPNNPMRNHPGFKRGNKIVGAGGTPTSWGNANGLYSTAAGRQGNWGTRHIDGPGGMRAMEQYWASRRKAMMDWMSSKNYYGYDAMGLGMMNEDTIEGKRNTGEAAREPEVNAVAPAPEGEGGGAGLAIQRDPTKPKPKVGPTGGGIRDLDPWEGYNRKLDQTIGMPGYNNPAPKR